MTIALLIEAAVQIDTLFWDHAYGPYDSLLALLRDPDVRPVRRDELRTLGRVAGQHGAYDSAGRLLGREGRAESSAPSRP